MFINLVRNCFSFGARTKFEKVKENKLAKGKIKGNLLRRH